VSNIMIKKRGLETALSACPATPAAAAYTHGRITAVTPRLMQDQSVQIQLVQNQLVGFVPTAPGETTRRPPV
jgi:hypothetical protein